MQIVLVYIQSFRRNSLLKCVLHPEIAKSSINLPNYGGSRSFKVIDVDSPIKLVTSACQKLESLGQPMLKIS